MSQEYQPEHAEAGSSTTPSVRPARINLLQRRCACGGTPGPDGECAACRAKRLSLQPRTTEGVTSSFVPPIVNDVLRSSGQPLEANSRAFMEGGFGHDFSRVRVHTDEKAAASARAVGALQRQPEQEEAPIDRERGVRVVPRLQPDLFELSLEALRGRHRITATGGLSDPLNLLGVSFLPIDPSQLTLSLGYDNRCNAAFQSALVSLQQTQQAGDRS